MSAAAPVLSLAAARRTPVLRGAAVVGSAPELREWLGEASAGQPANAVALAMRLREAGAALVCLLGAATVDGHSLDWLDSEHARGWLAATGRDGADPAAFSRTLGDALARGFVPADAGILARMGSGGAVASDGFVADPQRLPLLSWGEAPRFEPPVAAAAPRSLGLYAIVDTAQRLQQAIEAGVRTVQLRIKAPPVPDAAWELALRAEVQRSIAACLAADAQLFVNDHWQVAAACGAYGAHLGQEDLLALGEAGRFALAASGLALGVSSHSLWELCRARTLAPRYVACGPVWPTLTKAMPWQPQGLDNLAWWCRMAGAPVVAIGGVLGAQQVREAAGCGADGVCVVRGLGGEPRQVVPLLQAALAGGREEFQRRGPAALWPHPSLAGQP
jgi:hydroxymethylpyrimidine kinase/phosphomethylpyrimidine kinase/thiamine-phosphate diphosphorylase